MLYGLVPFVLIIECFCIKIHRNIEAEIDEEKYEIEHQVSNETKM